MNLALYHYVHCPFCVRVRLALGYLNLSYESIVLPYDDEATPIKLTGKKMLPILEAEGRVMNESLDIISYVDKANVLGTKEFCASAENEEMESLLNKLGNPIHSLAMPYWIYTPEFSKESRHYFQVKKEAKRGPFKDLVNNQNQYKAELSPLLKDLESKLLPYYEQKAFGIKDILLAAHLWGLYIVPEFQFSESIHHYLQMVKEKCHFNYHQDFWI
jgi:glutaredoxin 2